MVFFTSPAPENKAASFSTALLDAALHAFSSQAVACSIVKLALAVAEKERSFSDLILPCACPVTETSVPPVADIIPAAGDSKIASKISHILKRMVSPQSRSTGGM